MPYATEESFWAKVDNTGAGGTVTWNGTPCWLWTAAISNKGYGKTASGVRSRWMPAHRKSWALVNGEIGEDDKLLHRCDHPPCVNPDHLFIGTHQENMRDMATKGRQWQQKILLKDHGTIRHMAEVGISGSKIAKMYGVSYGAIWFVLNPDYKATHYKRRTA